MIEESAEGIKNLILASQSIKPTIFVSELE